jgi:uncharacterized membrane protein
MRACESSIWWLVMLIRDTALVGALLTGIAFHVSLFAYRRRDITLSAFIIAGPFILLRPSRYLRPDRRTIPPILFVLTMFLLVVVWLTSWAANNL